MPKTLTRGSLKCPPRFGTPRNFDLPTLGAEVGEIARRLGTPLMPWQQHVADVSYEYDPDSGLLMYDERDTLVPRQSGKTTYVRAKSVHRLTMMARRLGPQRSAYYAQTRLAARKKLERDFAPALRASGSFREVPHSRARPQKATDWRLTLNNGSESIEFGGGSYWQIDAPSRTGGHGDTLDDATVDEGFAHKDDTVEGSVRPAQATRESATMDVLSTAGDEQSLYLYSKVVAGREACESGGHGRVAYFEWSAPDDADPGDPETWWACSPALGITITEDFLAAEWQRALRKGSEGIDTFRRAYLNQWPRVPSLNRKDADGILDLVDWAACRDDEHTPGPKVAFGVHVTRDGRSACIAASDGRHGEITGTHRALDFREGTSWVVPRLKELQAAHGGLVALDPKGASGNLIVPLDAAGVRYVLVKLHEHAHACQGLVDDIADHTFRHIGQPELDAAVKGAGRRWVGDVWLWDERASSSDPAPLVAVTLARWAGQQSETYSGPLVAVT